jgi:hypothetical protein
MSILSSSQLHDVRLSDLTIRFNDEWLWTDEAERCEEAYDVEPSFDVFPAEDETAALIRLSLTCVPDEDVAGRCRFDEVSGTIWCIMRFETEMTSDERARRAYVNGPVILHGLLRGIMASATGTCVGGPFLLPVVNYVEVMARRMEQFELPEMADDDTLDVNEHTVHSDDDEC